MSATKTIRYLIAAGAILVCGGATGNTLLAISPVADDVIETNRITQAVDVDAAKPARTEATERLPSGNPLWAIPLRLLTATRERPIFSPSRRPPPPVVVGVPEVKSAPPPPVRRAVQERPQLVLVGTISGPEKGVGVFLDETTKEVFRLRTGEDHNGWVLRGVRAKEATLEKNDHKETLVFVPPAQELGAAPAATYANPLDQLLRKRRD